jgi:hypothetical protein
MCQKSAENCNFLAKISKNLHYGPISKKSQKEFLKYTFLEVGRVPTRTAQNRSFTIRLPNVGRTTSKSAIDRLRTNWS